MRAVDVVDKAFCCGDRVIYRRVTAAVLNAANIESPSAPVGFGHVFPCFHDWLCHPQHLYRFAMHTDGCLAESLSPAHGMKGVRVT